MHITLRRTLFWLFSIAFIVVGALLIVRTQGLVFDTSSFSFVKTGGIFVRAIPSGNTIYVDGEEIKRPVSLFNKGILVKDLAPGAYTVRVESPKRIAWEKTLMVEPGLVAAASFIQLFPDSSANAPEEKPLSPRMVEDFWLVKGGIIEKSKGKLYFGETVIKGTSVLESSPERNEIITTDADKNLYFVSLSGPETAINIRTLFASLAETRKFLKAKVRIDSVMLHPFSPESIIVRYGTGIFVLETKRPSLELLMQNEKSGVLKKTGNDALWVTATGTSAYNLVLGGSPSLIQFEEIVPESFMPDPSGNSFFAINKSGTLYKFERNNASSTEIAKNVRDFSFSASANRLLIVQNDAHSLFYYLSEDTGDVKTAKGELKLFPLAKKHRIESATLALWNTEIPEYIFFEKEGALIGAETDIRSPVNASTITNGIKKVLIRDEKFILLKDDGALTELTLEF